MSARELVYTLVCDGSSDLMLEHPIRWLLEELGAVRFRFVRARIDRLPERPLGLQARIAAAIELSGCDLLFVHRDAERQDPRLRHAEVRRAMEGTLVSHVPVVPVRMTEAWFLLDAAAIRRAASNPSGRVALNLPTPAKVESEADPKERLYEALKKATELPPRRLGKFDPHVLQHRVAELIVDFSPLRGVPAVRQLEADLREVLISNDWTQAR